MTTSSTAPTGDRTVRMVTVHGRRIRVALRAGEGTPLVLCNGIGAGLEVLQRIVDALDPSIPVIRFDVPGVGGSQLPPAPYNLMSLSSCLGRLLDALAVDEVDVLGISWGGMLAQQFALQHPRRCRRLVLVSTSTGALMVPGSPSTWWPMAIPGRHRDGVPAGVAPAVYGGRMRDEPRLAQEILGRRAPMTPTLGQLMQVFAGVGWTSLPWLPLIRQRTLVLTGADDPVVPVANGRVLSTLLPHAQLHVFPDGHLGLLTLADELAPRIARFLRQDPAGVRR